MSKINIVRPWAYFGCARELNVSVDGVRVGKIKSRETKEFDIGAGSHKIQVSMDWCKSLPFSVEISDNTTIYLNVETASAYTALLLILIGPSKVFWLTEVE